MGPWSKHQLHGRHTLGEDVVHSTLDGRGLEPGALSLHRLAADKIRPARTCTDFGWPRTGCQSEYCSSCGSDMCETFDDMVWCIYYVMQVGGCMTRLNYFTENKFGIVVEAHRNPPRIVRNCRVSVCGYLAGCFWLTVASLQAQCRLAIEDVRLDS